MAYWSFAEKTFAKQSMMFGVRKIAKKLNHTCRFEGKSAFLAISGVNRTCQFVGESDFWVI